MKIASRNLTVGIAMLIFISSACDRGPQEKRKHDERVQELLLQTNEGFTSGLITALAETKDPQVVEPIISALSVPETEISSAAAKALGELHDARAVLPLIKALDSSLLRQEAAVSLGLIGDLRATEPLFSIIVENMDFRQSEEEIPAFDYVIKDTAVNSLKKLNASKITPIFVDKLKRENGRRKAAAAFVLGSLGDDIAVNPLLALIGDRDPHVRVETILALGKLGDARAVEPLIKAMDSPYSRVSKAAIISLGYIKDPRAVGPLVKRFINKKSPHLDQVDFALWTMLYEMVGPELLPYLKSNDSYIKCKAADLLGRMGNDSAAKHICGLLNDPDDKVRYSAGEALVRLHGGPGPARQQIEEALRPALDKHDLAVIAAIYELIGSTSLSVSDEIFVKALEAYGSSSMAEYFLNTRNKAFVEAAKKWADQHGYGIETKRY